MRRLIGVIMLAVGVAAVPSAAQPTAFQFAAPIVRPFGKEYFPTHIAAADLNHDGKLDLVISGRDVDGIVFYMFGNGDGTFGPLQQFNVGDQSDWVELRDFNHDGALDAAVAVRSLHGRIAIVWGNPDGTFSDRVDFYDVGRETRSLAAADFNGDGQIDLAAMNYYSADLVVLLGDSHGAFTRNQRQLINEFVAGSALPQQVIAGDVNGDGRADLLVTSIGSGCVNLLRNLGSGGAFAPEIAYVPPMLAEQQVAVTNSVLVDIDRDGDLDVISPLGALSVLPRFAVFRNNGQGDLGAVSTFPSHPLGAVSWVVAAGDLDGDGDADLAFGFGLPGDLTLVRNDSTPGQLAFGAPQLFAGGDLTRDVMLCDVNHDCALDVVMVDLPSHTFRVYLNHTPQQSGCGGAAAALAAATAASPRDETGGRTTGKFIDVDLNHDGMVTARDQAASLAGMPAMGPRSAAGPAAASNRKAAP